MWIKMQFKFVDTMKKKVVGCLVIAALLAILGVTWSKIATPRGGAVSASTTEGVVTNTLTIQLDMKQGW